MIIDEFEKGIENTTKISGGSGGGPPPPLILDRKEEKTEGKMADRARKSRSGPPFAQGLDPPLKIVYRVIMKQFQFQ